MYTITKTLLQHTEKSYHNEFKREGGVPTLSDFEGQNNIGMFSGWKKYRTRFIFKFSYNIYNLCKKQFWIRL